ncbi:hypothetical protein HK105_202785 [Polyrhizophydium stewartii]|uniref:Uncharacterized protein n=1 Tax=Polyrhizophydium stewartii TaxID=2732419 RepID=A0ABR4NDE6_9FUNG|nr:hypothetical protein HK105_006568 [Polyrhizophydium stewartii]
MPAIMACMRDDIKEIRSSALSLLARVADVAPLALLPFIEQISDYLIMALRLERMPEARRGSAVVISALIRSLGADAPTVLTMPRILAFQKQLRMTRDGDEDALLRQHAQVALQDIADCLVL